MAMRCDRDGLGAARVVGGGGVAGGFHNTQTMPTIDLRDPEIRRRQAVPFDMRNAAKYKGKMSEQQLLTFASTTMSRSAFNRKSLPKPELGRQLREETNGSIQEYNRQMRSEVLRLSQADLAAAEEHKALSHTFAKLLKMIEVPERVLWLSDVSRAKSSNRPTPDDPNYRVELEDEAALARRWLLRLQDRARGTKNAMKTFGESRGVLANYLKTLKIGTDLLTDSYSGAATGFPAARFDDPPCLTRLAEQFSASQDRRAADEAMIKECGVDLTEAREKVQNSLDDALKKSKEAQRELILAKGAARLARNKVLRNEHTLTIATGCNEGPAEGVAYMATRERCDRPLVRKYNEVPGHRQHGVTVREESRTNRDLFKSSLTMVEHDDNELGTMMRAMSATLHDRNRAVSVDADIRRQRARLSPGRRP